MRSRKSHTISAGHVHQWAIEWLLEALPLKAPGWKCTALVVWNIILRAAARTSSLGAASGDLSDAPSSQAVFDALDRGLPKTLKALENQLDRLLAGPLPSRWKRAAWTIAIDWHLVPYYGQPERSANELYYGKPTKGTSRFHAYATACIVSRGMRYTLAATWVRRHESLVTGLQRLFARIDARGLKIKRILLDRAFFNVPVTEYLQSRQTPFLMPVVFRGRPPKKKGPRRGLWWIRRQKAGWHVHTLRNGKRTVTIDVSLAYRTHKNRRDGKRKQQKLLFGSWRVSGSAQEIRQLYRKRFGIETSYRQQRQARIMTCTRDPHHRLLFFVIGLMLRNLWLWIHETRLSPGSGVDRTLELWRLRFRRMLDWLAGQVVALFHDGSTPSTQTP
ncbi:MAG: transposase [Planctomyces sp.]|nr:transposase [Planctomyces sp.]